MREGERGALRYAVAWAEYRDGNFPSFSEGLSLRDIKQPLYEFRFHRFPFLFGGTFIEGFVLEYMGGGGW